MNSGDAVLKGAPAAADDFDPEPGLPGAGHPADASSHDATEDAAARRERNRLKNFARDQRRAAAKAAKEGSAEGVPATVIHAAKKTAKPSRPAARKAAAKSAARPTARTAVSGQSAATPTTGAAPVASTAADVSSSDGKPAATNKAPQPVKTATAAKPTTAAEVKKKAPATPVKKTAARTVAAPKVVASAAEATDAPIPLVARHPPIVRHVTGPIESVDTGSANVVFRDTGRNLSVDVPRSSVAVVERVLRAFTPAVSAGRNRRSGPILPQVAALHKRLLKDGAVETELMTFTPESIRVDAFHPEAIVDDDARNSRQTMAYLVRFKGEDLVVGHVIVAAERRFVFVSPELQSSGHSVHSNLPSAVTRVQVVANHLLAKAARAA
jgi:hypothetical protein